MLRQPPGSMDKTQILRNLGDLGLKLSTGKEYFKFDKYLKLIKQVLLDRDN